MGDNGVNSQVLAKTVQNLTEKVSELEGDKLMMMAQLKQANR